MFIGLLSGLAAPETLFVVTYFDETKDSRIHTMIDLSNAVKRVSNRRSPKIGAITAPRSIDDCTMRAVRARNDPMRLAGGSARKCGRCSPAAGGWLLKN